MNNKAFTLIEMLGTMVILAILSTITIVSTTTYLKQSRLKSYKIMSQSVYEATMNCITGGKCDAPSNGGVEKTYTTDYLISNKYLEKLKNPLAGKRDCTGSVNVKSEEGTVADYNKISYKVTLNCEGLSNETIVWPSDKK